MKIAVLSGKGGTGKTTIMAVLAEQLKRAGREVLIIDADPSPHMAQTIGIETEGLITPIAEMRDLLAERSSKVVGSSFYNLNPEVNDLISRFIVEKDSIRLMVLGAIQTGAGGCACPESTVLKRLLTKLLLSPSQAILLDMEAGVEHLGRGTIASVDILLVVVIPSKSSVRTALKIRKLADDAGIPKVLYVGNLIQDQTDEQFLLDALGEPLAALFPDSGAIRKAERDGKPVISMDSEIQESAVCLMNQIVEQINGAAE